VRKACWLWLWLAGGLWAQAPGGDAPVQPLEPKTAEVLQQAYEKVQAGRMDEAKALLQGGLAATPKAHQLLDMLGTVHFKLGELDRAEEVYVRMAETPLRSTALFNLGEVRMLRKDYAGAAEAFEKFLKTPGNKLNGLARMKLYISHLKAGNMKAAEALDRQVEPTISHPLYYMVRAAAEFQAGRAAAGTEYVLAAQEIYGTPMVAAFAQTFVDIGWMGREQVPEVGELSEWQLRSLNREFRPVPVSVEVEQRGLLDNPANATTKKK
jgi:tetratricopeptide (TPR) repeat protein